MSVIGLPVNLGVVADVADAKFGGRYSTAGVEVYVTGDGKGYRVAATDTRRLVLIEGETKDASLVPGMESVKHAPNSARAGIVPAKEFKKIFADAAKATKRQKADVQQVVTSLGQDVATFGASDFETEQVQQTRLIAGKFPPVADMLSDLAQKTSVVKFTVDAKYLADLAKIAAGFVDPETMRLEVEVYGAEKPIVMTAVNGGQKLTMLLMPFSAPKAKGKKAK